MTEQKALTVVDTVRKMEPEFAALLKSSNTDEKKFMNNALMAIAAKPEIAAGEVTRKSVFDVCSRAANDGVVLDGKEAAMIIGKVERDGKWIKEAQYRLMAAGAMKIIQRSPNIQRVVCQLIYENDEFLVDFVTDKESVVHKITPEALKKGRGQIVGVYFTAKLANGEWTSPEIMSVAEVNEVRDKFGQKNSKMWINSWGEAARKTVLHRARKRLPLEGKVDELLSQDDEEITEIIDHQTGEVLNAQPEPQAKRTKTADKVKAAVRNVNPEPEQPTATVEEAPIYDADFIDTGFGEDEVTV